MRTLWMSMGALGLLAGCRDKAADTTPADTGVADTDDADSDGYGAADDCDDANSAINPGAAEICDGIDNNCDGTVDEGVTSTYYADTDGDGFGDSAAPAESCSEPGGFVAVGNDCDDTDPDTYPAAAERCDGVDNDCDGDIDEEVTSTWYADADTDGYGDADAPLEDCDPPTGYTADDTDCDDTDAGSYPGAAEVCDEADNNCDGTADEGVTTTFYADSDDDDFGDADSTTEACDEPAGYAAASGDCDDAEATTHPGADEYCDGVDNDCDTVTDEDDAADAPEWYADSDGDGFGDADDAAAACAQPAGRVADDTDCDDAEATTHPGADEYCDEIDNDCDGATDEDAVDEPTWNIDYDGDGYGSSSFTLTQCAQPTGYLEDDSDCDDSDDSIYPGADEYCDTIDSDCDGVSADDDAIDAETFYADGDGDGYGDPDSTTAACAAPSGYVADDTDCDDAEADAYPGSTATETPSDGVDQDCDGNDFCTDLNCDGRVDLFQAVHYSGSSYTTSSRIYYNNGSGYSDADVDTIPSYGTFEAEVEDLDGDGYKDIVLANYRSGSDYTIDSYIYYGSATGYSSADRDAVPTNGASDLAISDLDGDGYHDIVFVGHYNGSSYVTDSYVYYGSASGYSTASRDDLPGAGARRVVTSDLDGDGYEDIVLCNYYSGSSHATSSYVYYGSARGYSSKARDALPTLGCRDVTVDDLNGDGYEDIVFASYYSGSSHATSSYIYYGTASGYSSAYRDSLPTTGSVGVETADIDQDGYTDVIFGGYYAGSWSGTPSTYVYYNSSLGFSSSVYDSLSIKGIWRPLARDINSDGYPDLILPRYYSGSSHATTSYLYYGASSGLGSAESFSTTGSGKAAVGDIDQDGLPDIVFNNYYSGSWSTLVDTYVYYGATSGYSSANRDELDTQGSWPTPILVGHSDWE